MKTPKEKAEELVEKMYQNIEGYGYKDSAIDCALIAVDELIEQENKYNNGSFYPSNFWKEVKHEIEKL